MRFLVIFFILLACPISCFAYTVNTYQPYDMNNGVDYASANYGNYPKMTQIEQILFKRGYEGEDIYLRLVRAEKNLFHKTYPQADLNWRMENILANIDTSSMYNISISELSAIEQKVLGRRYQKDNLENRIARLEQQMFGTMQGGQIDERYDLIKKSALNYNNIASAAYPTGGYYSPGSSFYPNSGGIKGTIRNILSSMVGSALPLGTMTGFTPPMTSSPYCYDPYGFGTNANSGFSRSYATNTGYYNQNNSYGSGSGVTVLDN